MRMKVITIKVAVPEDQAGYYLHELGEGNPAFQEVPVILDWSEKNPNNEEKHEIKAQIDANGADRA